MKSIQDIKCFLSENVVANETDHGHRKKLKIIVAIVGNDNIYRT